MSGGDDANRVLIGRPAAGRLLEAGRRLRLSDATHPWVMNTVVVVVIFLLFGVPDLHDPGPTDAPITFSERPPPQMTVLQCALILPLWWRRRAPLATFYTVLAVFVVQWSAGIMLRADVAVLVATYSLVLHGSLRRMPWAVPGLAVAVVLVVVRLSGVVSVGDVLFFLVSVGTAAVALGFSIRIRRAQLAALRERADQLEIERDHRSRLAAATERTRVAREMHDILGHSLSVMITLADGGRYAVDVAPERSKKALQMIADTGRGSLDELRRLLGVLREQTGEPNLSPQPGIADLDLLCEQIRAAGPRVRYRSAGALHALDAGVELAAYRIVQEALTNALKYAGPLTHIDLVLRIDGDRLRITVRDTGPRGGDHRTPPAGHGHGLIGMRERAGLYAGTVVAGPVPGGGWAVWADLEARSDIS